jgi:hypothetical protein
MTASLPVLRGEAESRVSSVACHRSLRRCVRELNAAGLCGGIPDHHTWFSILRRDASDRDLSLHNQLIMKRRVK